MSRNLKPQLSVLGSAVIVAMLAAFGTAASAQTKPSAQTTTPAATPSQPPPVVQGYVGDSTRSTVVNPYGLCYHTGFWTPAQAADPCDATARVAVAPPPPAPVVQPAPPPPPVALAPAPAPKPPILEKLTLSSDVLFDFDKATLKDSGKQKLDELVARIKDAKVEGITAIGHADRIASEKYNQVLSEQRAQSVKEYLAQKGVPTSNIKAEGKGESEPVTGDSCKHMGPETGKNRKLVACLQPDRRVDIEVAGTRQVAAGSPAAGPGTTSGTTPGDSGGATSPGASSPSSGSGTTGPK
jgi:OOP family OmpA-OmpF porin